MKSASLTKTVYWVDNNDEAETREEAKEALAENVKIFFSEEGGAYTQLTEGNCGKFGLKELPEIGISEGDATHSYIAADVPDAEGVTWKLETDPAAAEGYVFFDVREDNIGDYPALNEDPGKCGWYFVLTTDFTITVEMKDGEKSSNTAVFAKAVNNQFHLQGDAKTGKIDIAFKDVDWKKPDVTSGISSAEMSCTVRKFNLDGSRITYKISFDNTGVPNFGAITEAAYDGGKILLILAGTTTFTATKEWLEPADEEITRPEATFELWRYRAGQNYTSASRKLQKQLMSLPGPGRRMRHPGLIPLKAPMIQNWSAAIFKTLPAVYTNNSASGTQYIEYRIVEKSITYTLSGGEQTTVEAKVNDDPAAGTWTYAYTDDIMQPAYRKGASAYTSSDREVYNALKTTGLTVTKKWAEDEDNTYKTRPQTKQSGADWETSFLIQRKSGADGWETVKTYSGSADAPLIITLYGKNVEAQATGSVSGLPSGEYRAVELQPGYDAGKPEGSIIAPDAGEEAVYNKAYTAAYELDPGKNATTVTNTLNTVQYGLQKKWANNDHGNIVSVTVELQYQAADDKWTSFSEVTLDGTADDAAGKSCYEDAAWHALWTAVPEYLPGSMTDKSGHTLYRIVEKAGEGYEAVAGDTATKFTEQNGLYTAELTNRLLIDIPVEKIWDDSVPAEDQKAVVIGLYQTTDAAREPAAVEKDGTGRKRNKWQNRFAGSRWLPAFLYGIMIAQRRFPMSLQFIFGNSGSGKSHRLYRDIIEQSIRHPEKNYIVLVPEQFTMQTQKDLCLMHPRGGIMNIDVLSFGRLAHRVFEELGQESRTVLDDEGKNLILRKIAGNYEDQLIVLKGNLKKQGYISEVKSVISEFTQYGIGFAELDEFMDGISPDSYLHYKLQDIRTVYEGFEDYLSGKYITKEEMLDVLSSVVSRSEILKGSVVAMDGFTGFTPVQVRLLGELLRACSRVVITVTMDEREDPFVYNHPYQLFALSKQMVTSLVKTARETGTEIEDPVCLYGKPPKRFEHNEQMAFLESELFRYSGAQYHGNGAVSLHEARSPRQEAQFAAGEIRRLVREEGYRYRDIAVITADMNVYADALEKACGLYDIPVFMDHKKSILLNAFVEYIRSLLAMAEQNFSYDSVFRFLRTGLAGFTDEEVDRMENYCLALGIRGYKKWQQAWVRRTAEAGEEELQELNHLRVRFVEKIQDLVYVLKQRRKTVRDVTLAVYEFIASEHMQERIAGMEALFQEQGELALAKEYAQIYRIVLDLFDKFVELLGDESISLKEYCDLLDAGLEEAKVGVIPPSLDQVVIGDVERTRIKNVRALFFLGANDTLLPGNAGAGGFLSVRDREKFREKEMPLSPGPKEQVYIQKFYLYMNLTKPSEYLYLSWSKVSAEGKSIRPAYLVNDIRRLFPDLQVMDEEKRRISGREFSKKTGILAVAEGVRDRRQGLDQEWKELYSRFFRDASEKEAMEQILGAGFLKRAYPDLLPGQAEALYPDPERISVTRMEKFTSCAYAHFLSYGLRLSDREEYSFEAVDLGNIAHQSLERFSRKADREKLRWQEIPDDVRDEMIDACVEESVLDYGNTVLFSTARNEYMIRRIRRLIRRSVWALTKQLEKGDFVPGGYELKFGSGKIDRIDICEDEADNCVYVKVTDYKTGMKSFDITALYHGLQMQLPVYMNAALEAEKERFPDKEIVPAGIFYYRIQDPVVDRSDSDQDVEERILKELRLDGLINDEKASLEHLERGLAGASLLIPAGRNKDGSLSKNSHALPAEVFRTVLAYAGEKERQIRADICAGKAQAAPYQMKDATGCDYCAYRDICGFDLRISGCRYRRLEKYKTEDAVAKMWAEMKKSGGADQ